MNKNLLSIRAKIKILKPASEIFEAIVDPEKMSNYFISKGSARMEPGGSPFWNFPEFEEGFTVRVGKVNPNSYVSFNWDSEAGETLVEISLEETPEKMTIVTITEGVIPNNEAGIKWLQGNTEGWANFLASMKAWLEYGVHLRKGAFDF